MNVENLVTSVEVKSRKTLDNSALLGAAAAGTIAVFTAVPAHAGPIDDIVTDTAKLQTIYDAATPIVVGVTMFAAAIMVLKKLVYA